MKLIVCGKGGCGKSTVAVLLSRAFARLGRRVMLVDADESNMGLHRLAGTAPAATLSFRSDPGRLHPRGGRRKPPQGREDPAFRRRVRLPDGRHPEAASGQSAG